MRLENATRIPVGTARIDITPDYPIRLSGYAIRESECEGIEQRLWAQAMAIGGEGEAASLLLTVDNTGVPEQVTDAVFERVAAHAAVARENFSICSTHTHHSPMLSGVLPNLFSRDLSSNEEAAIERYTGELVDKLEEVALAALSGRKPACLSWGRGTVEFAKNRRTEGGPVDHFLPLLCVRFPEGKLRAVFTRYACHCTTVAPRFNRLHGDWAGEARAAFEAAHPGAMAMIAIGCAGDANPDPRRGLEFARQHGESVAAEASRLLGTDLKPLSAKPRGKVSRVDLPFESLPDRRQWEDRATQPGVVGYHARKNLDRLDRGETLPATLPYSIQAWIFGDELAMLFLPGEVVVDYAHRLENEFDRERLWINAYANDVPCYIPSRRILAEGGYEAEESQWFYDRPARFAPETEEVIVEAVHQLIQEFRLMEKSGDEDTPSSGTGKV